MAIYAQLDAPDLYERALLVAPFFHVAGGPVVRYLTTLLAETPTIDQMQVRFGPLARTCMERQRAGWAGLVHVSARAFRWNPCVRRKQRAVTGRKGPAAGGTDRGRRRRPGRQRRPHRHADREARWTNPICIPVCSTRMRPMSSLSPEENPGEEMPWLPGLTRGAVDFLAHGQFFPTIAAANGVRVSPRCRL